MLIPKEEWEGGEDWEEVEPARPREKLGLEPESKPVFIDRNQDGILDEADQCFFIRLKNLTVYVQKSWSSPKM